METRKLHNLAFVRTSLRPVSLAVLIAGGVLAVSGPPAAGSVEPAKSSGENEFQPEEATKAPEPAPPGATPAGNPVATPVADSAAATPAAASTPTESVSEGKQVLLRAVDAVNAINGIEFRVKRSGTGVFASDAPSAEGRVRVARDRATRQWSVEAVGEGRRSEKSDAQRFHVVWHGSRSVEWLDEAAKKLMERPLAGTRNPTVGDAKALHVPEILDARPFSKELAASEHELLPQEEVGGVLCHVVAPRTRGRGATRWWIGVADNLPRKSELALDQGQLTGSMTVEITEVRVDNDLTPESLRIQLPEGFERDVQLPAAAPAPSPPPLVQPTAPNGTSTASPGTPAASASAPQQPAPPPPPPPAPDFSARTSTGEQITNQSLAGTIAVLDFGGTWSVPTRKWHAEVSPLRAAIMQRVPDAKVTFVSFMQRERDATSPGTYFADRGLDWTLVPEGEQVATRFGVKAFPTIIVVDSTGVIRLRVTGYKPTESAGQVERMVLELLGIRDESKDAPSGQVGGARTGEKAPTPTGAQASLTSKTEPASKARQATPAGTGSITGTAPFDRRELNEPQETSEPGQNLPD
ncbi:MAG: TlpA disulfide reductase family protein [Planctomycetota bacterium]|nr:TlpA disulfide reductase family protein [Planctomycetota bacterium]